MMLRSLRLFLLALWLGAAIFFSVVVAPTIFSVLRSFALPNTNEIAGTIVGQALAVVNTTGFTISLLLLLSAFAVRQGSKRSFLCELILLLGVVLATGVGQWVIAARMYSLRAALTLPLDQTSPDDPRRLAFDSMHHYSVATLAIAMMAALIAFFVMARRGALTNRKDSHLGNN